MTTTIRRRVASLEQAAPSDVRALLLLGQPVDTVTLGGERFDRREDETEAAFTRRLERSGKCRSVLVLSEADERL